MVVLVGSRLRTAVSTAATRSKLSQEGNNAEETSNEPVRNAALQLSGRIPAQRIVKDSIVVIGNGITDTSASSLSLVLRRQTTADLQLEGAGLSTQMTATW